MTAAALERRIANGLRRPPPEGAAPRFTRERLADIDPQIVSALVKDILPRTGVAFFAGPSTSAKTFLAIEVTLRVSRGEPVSGHRTRQAGAVYVAAEDANGVRQRVKAWRLCHGDHGAFQLIPQAPNLRDPDSVAALEAVIGEAAYEMDADGVPLGLVVIDTVSKAAPGADQNASGDMGDIMSTLEGMAGRLNVLMLVLAHTPKDESRGIAGWYGQFAGADAVVMCTRDADDDHLRVATVAKAKNGQDGQLLAFRLEEMQIGTDEDGDPVTSCVVIFETPPAKVQRRKPEKRLSANAGIILKALLYVYDNCATFPAPPIEGVAPHMKAVKISDVREWALRSGLSDDDTKPDGKALPGTQRERWSAGRKELLNANRARQHDELIWPL